MFLKQNIFRKLLTGVVATTAILYMASPVLAANVTSDNFTLTLMHTNDTHAHLDQIAKRVTAVKEVRAKKPNALLIDAGDVFSGTLYFNEFKGQADLTFMNLMQYDVMTFGNHEFDLGATSEGHKALSDFVKGASFPFVSTNVDYSKDQYMKGLYEDSISSNPKQGTIYKGIVKTINSEKVGIFGLTTEETIQSSSPVNITFSNYIEEAKEAVASFEKQGINKIMAVTHIGYDDNVKFDNDRMLASAVEGIDIIVGGHSHTQLNEPVVIDTDLKGDKKDITIIVQAYQYNDFLGTVDVDFNREGKIVGHSGRLIKLADQKEDLEAVVKLKPYVNKIAIVKNTPSGATAMKTLKAVGVRKNETKLGNLLTDAMLDQAKEIDKDIVIAFQNGGGIRSAINQGEITLGDILTVLPFGNTLVSMKLTGAEIQEALEHSVSNYPKENGGFLHVSGMKFIFDSSKPVGSRVQKVEVKGKDGVYTTLQKSSKYRIVTHAFTAKGGDGCPVFKRAYDGGRVNDLGLSDWENVRRYMEKLKNVNPKIEGRIIDLNESILQEKK
ncbi:bifunctional metallophosphatase/5'-nucleotidase [Bacillus sp. JJ722]|uniref:bifunctional metallophosphatase/5'-nucleotidase n=1 Tax=Bacillus sp. JJ722 TaxID=3122973 RepID=UPI002FFDBE85